MKPRVAVGLPVAGEHDNLGFALSFHARSSSGYSTPRSSRLRSCGLAGFALVDLTYLTKLGYNRLDAFKKLEFNRTS